MEWGCYVVQVMLWDVQMDVRELILEGEGVDAVLSV